MHEREQSIAVDRVTAFRQRREIGAAQKLQAAPQAVRKMLPRWRVGEAIDDHVIRINALMGIIDPCGSNMPHVLIVDDDTDVQEMLEMFLGHSGYTIACAADGAAGLQKMREQPPCLVLLDLMMPVMSGWQFRELQLADPAIARIPVVCITAAYDAQTVSRRLGVPCLQKPVDLEALVSIVHRACSGLPIETGSVKAGGAAKAD